MQHTGRCGVLNNWGESRRCAAKALVDTLAETLGDTESKTHVTLGDVGAVLNPWLTRRDRVKTDQLADMLAEMWGEMEAETLFDTLDDMKAEGLINKKAKDLAEGENKTQGKVKAEALVEWLVNMLAELKAESLSNTRDDFGTVALVSTPPHTLAKVKPERIGDTRGDVEEEALLLTLADTSKSKRRGTWRQFGRCGGRDVGPNTAFQTLGVTLGDVHLLLVLVDTG